ncbi:MAG: hypothetical protein K2X81_01640, partial [Candidatus Obscuribacterales bacterium]|nr:hypothetical protein [Candidatus Obscuribacterales bacterium]
QTDEQIKAAIEHLSKIAEVRAKQLSDAQELATKSHVTPAPVVTVQKTQQVYLIHLVLATVGGLSFLLLLAFAVSALKRKRR